MQVNLVPAFQTDLETVHEFLILCLQTFLPRLRLQPLPQVSYTDLSGVCGMCLLVDATCRIQK